MKNQDVLAMFITFSTGLLAGVYLYVVGFAPQLEKVSDTIGTDVKESYADLTIIGKRYGGCERGNMCDSFQIRGDGAYSYLSAGVTTGAEPVTGELPSLFQREIDREISAEILEELSQPVVNDTCDSYMDMNDYRYNITFESKAYDLDTCRSDFSHDTELGATLDKLWNYFQTLEEV